MKKLCWIVSLLGLVPAGCMEHGNVYVAAPAARPVPDREFEEGGRIVRFYDAANPHTSRVLRKVTVTHGVRSERERFEERGYRYRSDLSFVTEGVRSNGLQNRITAVAMENTAAPEDDVVFIFFLSIGEWYVVVPARLVRSELAPGRHYVHLDGDLWFGAVQPLWEIQGPPLRGDYFSWRLWSVCVAQGARTSLSACPGQCRSPAALSRCITACSDGAFMASLVRCTFERYGRRLSPAGPRPPAFLLPGQGLGPPACCRTLMGVTGATMDASYRADLVG